MSWGNLELGAVVNLVLSLVVLSRRLLSRSGAAAAFLIGTSIYTCLGWQGWLVLCAFFFGGTAASFYQLGRKQRLGVAQAEGGRRRWRHAWANAGVGVLCAAAAAWNLWRGDPLQAEACRWAFVACFAAALSDTLSSEFGQLAGQAPRLITTGEEVKVGTDGGITRAGTLMGLLGATLLSLLGRFLDITPVRATLPVLLAGLSGNLLDSYLGATLERQGRLSNEGVNFTNTLAGAVLGWGGFWGMRALAHWMQAHGMVTWSDAFI